MKKWNLLSKSQITNSKIQKEELLDILLENRGIKIKEKEDFLNPSLSKISLSAVGINKQQVLKALKRIKKAIKNNEQIIVFGDYDVDGICGSAILWETLNSLGAKVLPYIPSRFEEGYGLSKIGISNVQSQISNIKLIITVDNGIVANKAVDFAKKQGIDVIITDHHTPSKKHPKAFSIIHTTNVCGAGVAYLLSSELTRGPVFSRQSHVADDARSIKLKNRSQPRSLSESLSKDSINDFNLRKVSAFSSSASELSPSATPNYGSHLELVCLATIADLVPLTKANRILVYFGLKALRKTKRIGLLALLDSSGIQKENIGVYEIGHIIAPRLNAMGRLESAMDSLRLICTKNPLRAKTLAKSLSDTNLQRQEFTLSALNHAKNKARDKILKNLIFIADKSYQQGIIGLVAGRLVEEFYMPSIVISKGEKFSKASARSVKGFNIIDFLRKASDLMVDIGGHPMAAGFTVETAKLELLEKRLYILSAKLIKKDYLQRFLNIDLELPENLISLETFEMIQKLAPFGMANPEPTFLTKNVVVSNLRYVGTENKHLKVRLKLQPSQPRSDLTIASSEGRTLNVLNARMIEGIIFNFENSQGLKIEDRVDIVYTLGINEWNGNKKLQLKIKDINKS